MKKVAVGSTNPVKIEAVRSAFKTVWPDEEWEVEGCSVSSGVSDQPMSDEESIKGATNRSHTALKELGADYGVGLEGGIQQIGDEWFESGWMVVTDNKGKVGVGSTVRIVVPKQFVDLIHSGKELGQADDIVFGAENSKQASGHFGLMTNDAITRTRGFTDGVISALALFIHPEL